MNERVWAVLAGLALFGILYDELVEYLERYGHDRGYLGFIVSFGVAVTCLGWALITADWTGLLLLIGAFAASGTPMILGSIRRYLHERFEAEQRLRQATREALHE
jgi:hypothetical protein